LVITARSVAPPDYSIGFFPSGLTYRPVCMFIN